MSVAEDDGIPEKVVLDLTVAPWVEHKGQVLELLRKNALWENAGKLH